MNRRYSWRSSRSRAFTLIELLVVIGIIGILLSLTLPAVQSAREASHRVQCSNNIRQLGLAVLQYESANHRLPPGGIVEANDKPTAQFGTFNPRSGKMFSWVVLVLPYFEQGVLYGRFDKDLSVLHQPNEPQATYLAALACPSDVARDRVFEHDTLTEGKQFAKGNYAAFVSPYHVDLQFVLPAALGGNGQPLKNITDGLSNTVMLSEVLTRDDPHDQRGAWALPWTASSLLATDAHCADSNGPMVQAMRTHIRRRISFLVEEDYVQIPIVLDSIQTPNKRVGAQDILYSCKDMRANQLDGMPCAEWTKKVSLTHYLSAAPRSNHLNGVNSVNMDGRVDFITDDIDPILMAFLVSIADAATQPNRPSPVTAPQ